MNEYSVLVFYHESQFVMDLKGVRVYIKRSRLPLYDGC